MRICRADRIVDGQHPHAESAPSDDRLNALAAAQRDRRLGVNVDANTEHDGRLIFFDDVAVEKQP